MIKMFRSTDKIYSSNCDVVIQPPRAKAHKEDNGDYYLNRPLNQKGYVMNTVISFTPAQLVSVLLAICAAIVTIATAINVINSWIQKRREKKQKPEDDQNERIKRIEELLVEYNKKFEQYDMFLKNDNRRLSAIEESIKIDRRGFLALIKHAIDGNDIESLKASRKELEDYLLNKA